MTQMYESEDSQITEECEPWSGKVGVEKVIEDGAGCLTRGIKEMPQPLLRPMLWTCLLTMRCSKWQIVTLLS